MQGDRYAAPPPAGLRIVPLDDLTAVYDRQSGQTHLLAPPAPEILELLADGPLSRDMLLARLAAAFDLADPDPALLDARLAELEAAGLLARA